MSDDGLTPRQRSSSSKWVKRSVFAVLAALVLFFGGLLVYVNFVRDEPDPLDEGDLTEALQPEATDASDGAQGSGGPGSAAPSPAATTTGSPAPTEAPAASAGAWVATGDSIVGYRIKEVLFGVDTEAVGRTNAVTGSLSIDGTTLSAADFTIDMTTVESDDGRRDNQYRQIMSVDEFPTATFSLTEPIDFGVEPADGATADVSATGELTLRGVTKQVTFDLTARVEAGRIGVLGNIPIVFSDYSIANPSRAGITTEDNGLLEFVLVFAPA